MKSKMALILGIGFLMAVSGYAETKPLSNSDIQKITGSKAFAATSRLADGKTYYELKYKDGKLAGYIFNTGDFVNDIKGYRGKAPIRMLAYVSTDGILKNFQVIASSETPKFLDKVLQNKSRYIDKSVFEPGMGSTDAVTGATFSSRAIAKTLEKAGIAFAKLIGIKSKQATITELPSTYAADADTDKTPPPGGSRNIDAKEYQELIKQKRLSGQPAMFAEPVK
jgi:Na+-translocating ferredoxin:NAD+ oxidoreductase RnfG subunit